jgi:hypothetical protein
MSDAGSIQTQPVKVGKREVVVAAAAAVVRGVVKRESARGTETGRRSGEGCMPRLKKVPLIC